MQYNLKRVPVLTVLKSRSNKETVAIGYRIGKSLMPGMVVGLTGKLGVGKTTLVKGIAGALGIDAEITSPSFTIVSQYLSPSGVELIHIDLYRTNYIRELEEIGLEEIINRPGSAGAGIAVIEWSERASPFIPQESIIVLIVLEQDGTRRIHIKGLEL
ncbi:tRNA threonylcarbamoyladenosine biosynthesis protein TsaE [subsurface metagenome]